MTPEEINEENLEALIAGCNDPEMLKELIAYAMQFKREDLLEGIVEKSIQLNKLVEKLQDFQITPPQIRLDFSSD
ncbi:hypothetical protein COW36_05670 [bacterium (Candidatus Blackallbacteria) CG17_big_fil_post_rev_8_21_14_2_50_48_46]|uniref:Uncharacterized protein n=1 Tax=bacterium (Candidatus Blackallbacteria) CG17_big_fil_post_rev_8_21_14_2_50_48_46 TaxID=2014261 RepID=A0A2M7G840_9BACT|nr:MAG: hypothetical protein COW64_21265 [bacterium (Candidatus Blackallbacteria) CG18_big_fil_WC_8_21_14_2_50_49_26]PIW18256.1 MAG: hypothetical protein COW36_05670 [bacterium (Candidatus Blackallbacteria) CG17_big_fil_post_rev_8_21_14_2_50_48_46]PIW50687.1 MAG: hypothetical protein COW20_01935 [bacterium (Candidatus Blackallbacteria) CG13_big_fil_rev_8_21_14_2_50_49_14]